MVDVTPFVIRELTGDRREVRLVERALPYRPFKLTGKQRTDFTWLPGAPQASVTVLGASEEPTTINGYWKDKYLGATTGQPCFQVNNEQVTSAREASELIDSIRSAGQLVEVTWLDKTRHGILTQFDQTWHTSADLEWSITFDWSSKGDAVSAAVFITDDAITDVFTTVKTQQEKLDDIGTPDSFGLSNSFLDTIAGIQQSIDNLIANIEDTIVNLTDRVLSPVRATRGLIATLSGIEGECEIMMTFMNNQVAGAMNGSDPDVASQSYNEKLSAELYREELRAWAKEMQRIACEQRSVMTQQISGDLAGTYIAKAGEDLRDVSRIFYQTPFEWRRIMVFNDLDTAELQAGQVVLVPKVNPAEDGQTTPGN